MVGSNVEHYFAGTGLSDEASLAVSGAVTKRCSEVTPIKPLIYWWARQDSNLQPDRYERKDKVEFVDFLEFSVGFDRVRCVLAWSFLVRNWCGSFAIETYI
jgi:hypothetical protein